MAKRISYRALNDGQVAYIFESFAKGKTVIEIASGLDLSRTDRQKRSIVYQRLSDAGIRVARTKNAVPSGSRVRLPHAEILRLYATGLGAPAIAKRLGCGTTIVNSVAARAGVLRKHKGRTTQHGYAKVRIGGRYVLEHRHIMEQRLGRRLEPHETVHHINGDGMDNRIENLQLRRGKHGKGMVHRCKDCGSFNVESVPIAERDGHAS